MSTLDWLLNPITAKDFFEQFFEQNPLLIQRDQMDYYDSILSIKDIEHVIDLGKNLSNFDINQSTSDGALDDNLYSFVVQEHNIKIKTGIDKIKIKQLLHKQKCPIVISHVHNALPKLKELIDQLSIALDGNCYADMFITPPLVSKGFGIHFDLNDVYVMQLYGNKRWEIYESFGYLPDQPHFYYGFKRDDSKYRKLLSIDLEAGNFLYLPRGFIHNVTTRNKLSIHLTIGCLNRKWSDVLTRFNGELASRFDVLGQKVSTTIFNNSCNDLQEIRRIFETELTMKALESCHKNLKERNSGADRPHITSILCSSKSDAATIK